MDIGEMLIIEYELGYKPMCPYGYIDCVGDCNYIKYNYPIIYKELGYPNECTSCNNGSEYQKE